jgi:hypothetical protein
MELDLIIELKILNWWIGVSILNDMGTIWVALDIMPIKLTVRTDMNILEKMFYGFTVYPALLAECVDLV